ncbi:MAG: heme-binding protein [Pseudomonadota bacterium]
MRVLLATALTLTLTSALAQEEDEGLVTFSVLKPELAIALATAAMEVCRREGYQVGVAVVDRFGVPQSFVRDRFAGPHVHETAIRKAWTAVSFRTDTLALAEVTAPGEAPEAVRDISMALALGGGVPIEAGGAMVGGVGVSGAPSPRADDDCARAGIAAIEDSLPF